MKTVSIRLEDSIYEELSIMLDAMGQTKQTFYESYTRTALRERSIPFIIKAPLPDSHVNNSKLEAFSRLETSRNAATEPVDYDAERDEAMNEKFGVID
jgi:antitoxin component of RelBE/YafQ-DinJ toxin-antitoxin module